MNRSASMTNLGIIFGGIGPEHEASLFSAKALIENFDPAKYQLSLFGIRKDGTWVVGPDAWEELFQHADKDMSPAVLRKYEPRFESSGNTYYRAYPPPRAFAQLDCIFNIVHG